jgi:hypothetical protein
MTLHPQAKVFVPSCLRGNARKDLRHSVQMSKINKCSKKLEHLWNLVTSPESAKTSEDSEFAHLRNHLAHLSPPPPFRYNLPSPNVPRPKPRPT